MEEAKGISRDVWAWVLVGVALGASIHERVPNDFVARWASRTTPPFFPVAALAGVPLNVNGAGVVPVGESLWSTGMPLGTVTAFIMNFIALFVPRSSWSCGCSSPCRCPCSSGRCLSAFIILGYSFSFIT